MPQPGSRHIIPPDADQYEADGPERPNGRGDREEYRVLAASDARGKRIANRTPWLDLPEPFDNLKIRVWLDYPQDVAFLWTPVENETKDAATKRVMEACKSVFLAHDGWEDEDGEIMPQPDTDEFWQRISTPLGAALVTRFFSEINGNPTSGASRKRKRPT